MYLESHGQRHRCSDSNPCLHGLPLPKPGRCRGRGRLRAVPCARTPGLCPVTQSFQGGLALPRFLGCPPLPAQWAGLAPSRRLLPVASSGAIPGPPLPLGETSAAAVPFLHSSRPPACPMFLWSRSYPLSFGQFFPWTHASQTPPWQGGYVDEKVPCAKHPAGARWRRPGNCSGF